MFNLITVTGYYPPHKITPASTFVQEKWCFEIRPPGHFRISILKFPCQRFSFDSATYKKLTDESQQATKIVFNESKYWYYRRYMYFHFIFVNLFWWMKVLWLPCHKLGWGTDSPNATHLVIAEMDQNPDLELFNKFQRIKIFFLLRQSAT